MSWMGNGLQHTDYTYTMNVDAKAVMTSKKPTQQGSTKSKAKKNSTSGDVPVDFKKRQSTPNGLQIGTTGPGARMVSTVVCTGQVERDPSHLSSGTIHVRLLSLDRQRLADQRLYLTR